MGNAEYAAAGADEPEFWCFEELETRVGDWPPTWTTTVDVELQRASLYVLARGRGTGPRVMWAAPYQQLSGWQHTADYIELTTPTATRRFVTPHARDLAGALKVATSRLADEIKTAREDDRRRRKLQLGLTEHLEVDAFFNPA
jgi:hypothetical protein